MEYKEQVLDVLCDLQAEMIKHISELEGGYGSFMVTGIVMGQNAMLDLVQQKIREIENR